jgi:thiol-disulfide isomerase/thioredoxin
LGALAAIELTDLSGQRVRLGAQRGKRTVLLFWQPQDELCQDMLPDVKRWEARRPADAPRLLIVATGTAADMRAQGLRSRTVLDPTFSAGNAIGSAGTPSAVLIDAQGRLVGDIAYGAQSVLALMQGIDPAEAPPDGSERIGTKPAALSLPGLDGKTVHFSDLRGQPTLVLFWDTDCGYCQRMLPDLKAWEASRAEDAPRVVIVATGDLDTLRSTAFRSPVVIDKDRRGRRAFRAYGTPMGVLLDAEGKVASAIAVGAAQVFALANGEDPALAVEPTSEPVKLAVGAPAPAVALPDLDGQTVTLADFQGQPTALLFWRPGCGFCQRMLDELKAWEANPPADAPRLLIVSSEDVASNRAQGLRSPIVLDPGFSAGSAFGATGTPSAVLVDAAGTIASGVAVGAVEVFGLLRRQNASPTGAEDDVEDADDEEELAVPAIGTPAPEVRLPDLDGTIVDLADRRGRPTALIFWDPECGFCQQMLPALKQWEENPPPDAPAVVLISAGSAEANKAQGIRSLVLLDDDFTVAESFGADGTPTAILLDAEGRVASELANGQDEALALLGASGPASG